MKVDADQKNWLVSTFFYARHTPQRTSDLLTLVIRRKN